MEEEIDLHAYVEVLLHHWKWIVGIALVAAVIGFVASSLAADTYRASSVVIVTEPRYRLQFDPRVATSTGWKPAYQAFPVLATSDGILEIVIDEYIPPAEAGIDTWGLSALSGMVEASSEGDPSLVVLSVLSPSAQASASIANVWAEALVQVGNQIYGGSEKDVTFFQDQAAEAAEALDALNSDLVEFEARNDIGIVEAQLESLRQAQDDYLTSQRTIAYIIQDIQGLRDQLAQQPTDQSLSLADALAALLLQIKAFNTQVAAPDAPAAEPIGLQIGDSLSLAGTSRAEQVDLLDDLAATLQTKSVEIDERLLELQPEILALQRQLQGLLSEQDRIVRAQSVARETYLTVARKLDEARIAAQEQDSTLRVGSYAAIPENPVGPRRLFNTLLAAMLGMTLGVIVVFADQFWRGNETTKRTNDDQAPLPQLSKHGQDEALDR